MTKFQTEIFHGETKQGVKIMLRYLVFAITTMAPIFATAAELRVEVQGVRGADGYVMVALFDSQENFEKDKRVAATMVKARAGTISVAFLELSPGDYVVSAYHDENNSGKMDTNIFGVPTEGYGFSNNATGFAGPPSFEDAALAVSGDSASAEFKLGY